jgi:hypothetical protein
LFKIPAQTYTYALAGTMAGSIRIEKRKGKEKEEREK